MRMKKFKCKLPHNGSPVLEVEAHDVDSAMDEAARKYGWDDYDEMRRNYENLGAWTADDGFSVELVRENDDAAKS